MNLTKRGHLTAREQFGSGLLFLSAALIIAPLYWRGLPCGHDTMTHLYRIMQLVLNGQDGAPFLQWGQHFMRGYGYPTFPFYAPLYYRLVTLFYNTGMDISQAMRFMGWLTLFIAGWGAYQLGRRYLRPSGAFITGLAYLFAPYLIFNGVQRGAFPELLGLALLPWALAAADVAMEQRTRRAYATAVFTFALVTLSHNIVPNFGFIILLGLALSQSKSMHPRAIWRAIAPALLIIIATLAMTAFFWLPAYVELDYTQTHRPDSPFTNLPRFEQHFTNWDEMAGVPSDPADPALSNPSIAAQIGLGQAVLGVIGLLIVATRPFPRRRTLLMWGLIGIVSLFFAAPNSWWLWTHLLPDFIRLPIRFLSPASLSAAILAGVVADGRWLPRRFSTPNLLLTAVFVSLSGWFWLYPLYCDAPAITAATIAQGEGWTEAGDITQWNGASLGETLPRWIDKLPAADELTPFYNAGEAVNRLILPETAVLHAWQSQPSGDSYSLHLSKAQTLTYRAFYFPGWRATVNGTPIPLTPRTGDGLIQIKLPAGDVQFSLHFGRTPLRWLMLVFSTVFTIGLLIWGWKRGPQDEPLPSPSRRTWGWFALTITLLFLLKAGIDRTNNPIRADRFVNGRLSSISNPASINFENEFMLLGYEGETAVTADNPFTITQYWTPLRGIGVPYYFRLYVVDENGRIWNTPFTRPHDYTDFPGKNGWQVGHYVRDAYTFDLLPGTPPGTYWLETAVFRADTDQSLMPQTAETGNNPSHARIGQLVVSEGDWDADNWSATAENAQVNTFAPTEIDNLTLLGWTIPNIIYRSGETAQLDLLWQNRPLSLSKQPITTTLWLRDNDGNTVTHRPLTVELADNAVVRDQVRWRLPAELESGTYTVWLGADEPALELGIWQIDAPPHEFTKPELVEGSGDAIFTTTFTELAGYNVKMTDDSIALTLIWHALATADDSYRVFVHLRDADGSTIAQSDAIPDNWTRPTTGWVADEYIRDKHTLTAAAGTYDITIGWYDAATGTRLGEATIGELTVE